MESHASTFELFIVPEEGSYGNETTEIRVESATRYCHAARRSTANLASDLTPQRDRVWTRIEGSRFQIYLDLETKREWRTRSKACPVAFSRNTQRSSQSLETRLRHTLKNQRALFRIAEARAHLENGMTTIRYCRSASAWGSGLREENGALSRPE